MTGYVIIFERIFPGQSFEPYFAACTNRSPGRYREDTHPVRYLEADRDRFLLRIQLRKSYFINQAVPYLSNTCHQLGHSCDPAARPSFDETSTSELSLIALRDLKKGDELTMAYVNVTQRPEESVTDARRRRRQELARGWKFACECSKCASDALVPTENTGAENAGNKSDDDLGVPLEAAKLEAAVARAEAQLAQVAVSEPPGAPALEPTPAPSDV